MDRLGQIVATLSTYGELLVSVLLAMVGGIVLILLLYRLVARMVTPGSRYARIIKVFFGAVYVMILVITALIAAEQVLDIATRRVAGLAMLAVVVGAVIVFFLLPFVPRLPFTLGDMVKIRDVLGTVDAITAYQVVIRTFDGQIVYFPTALLVTGPVINYSHTPHRRVELSLALSSESDIEQARQILLELMNNDHRTLADPAPAVYITGAGDGKVTLSAYSWVANSDWLATRDALYVAVVKAFADIDAVNLALPRVELVEDW